MVGQLATEDANFDAGYLPPGHHFLSASDIHQRFVSSRPSSLTRKPIFLDYQSLCNKLAGLGLSVHQMIGGSFPTAKLNPSDIDLVNCCLLEDVEGLSEAELAELSKYVSGDDTKAHCLCHSFLMIAPPDGHPDVEEYKTIRSYWERFFGFDRDGRPKGIVTTLVTSTPDPDVGAKND